MSEPQRECKIYKLINRINGKFYIGQTWQTLEERFNCGEGYSSCPYLYNAIKKHGPDKFEYQVLAICYEEEIADKLEEVLIEFYGCRNRNIGYNLVRGGHNHSDLKYGPVEY